MKLKKILYDCEKKSPLLVPEMIMKVFEVYKMEKNLKTMWLNSIFSDKNIEKLEERERTSSKIQKKIFSEKFTNLINELEEKYQQIDPCSLEGQEYARKWMDIVSKFAPDEKLRKVIWNAYNKDKIKTNGEDGVCFNYIPKPVILSIDQAVYFMYSGKKIIYKRNYYYKD